MSPPSVSNDVVQTQGSGPWLSFVTPDQHALGIAPGPADDVWYCDGVANALYRVAMNGTLTKYAVPNSGFCAFVTRNPDGNLYFGEVDTTTSQSGIGRFSESGAYTFFPAVNNTGGQLFAITSASDGHVWGLANGSLWRLNSDGT